MKNVLERIEVLRKNLSERLPGEIAQLRAAPKFRFSELEKADISSAIPSSILLLLYPFSNTLLMPVILRAEYNGAHSGQISFPGGRCEPHDNSLKVTALREAAEETGIDTQKVEILGKLTDLYIPRSNFIVYPFVGFMPEAPAFIPDKTEVQEIVIIDLLNPDHTTLKEKSISIGKIFRLNAPGYSIGNHFLWGASAMIFSEFLEVFSISG